MTATGLISDIQHCSVHDGPGIRTTVFLKGCNMRCRWCHNPETVFRGSETLTNPDKCIGCGMCESGCFSGAKEICGTEMSVSQVLAQIELDRPYYGDFGGVTVSGGEPMLQADFLKELLTSLRSAGIHTAIETNMSVETDTVLEVCALCDLVMCDLKLFDPERHKLYTRQRNDAVLRNIAAASENGAQLIVRTPVIAGINDSVDEISAIAGFLAGLKGILYYELLNYHPLGMSKATSVHFKPEAYKKTDAQTMKALADAARGHGLNVRIDNIVYGG